MASKIEWIKITTGMFEDEKLEFIDTLPEGDAIINIWVRLLCMAGKCNAGGYIFITEKIPYTEDALATKFRKKPIVVKMALETLVSLDMIHRDPDGSIAITNWSKHQNVDGMDRVREQTRERMARYRERLKLESKSGDTPDSNDDGGVTSDVTEPVTNDVSVTHSSSSVSNSYSSSLSLNSKESQKAEKPGDADALRLSALLLELHRKVDPKYLAGGSKADDAVKRWAVDIDKIVRLDGRTLEEVERIIRWAKADEFWCSNIISGKKLREKFPTLVAHAARRGRGGKPPAIEPPPRKVAEVSEEERRRANDEWQRELDAMGIQ